jgi:hypothetical protein
MGDYLIDQNGDLQIYVSKIKDEEDWSIALHELVESLLALKRKIPFEAIDAFDIEFEKSRKEGNMNEPGDNSKAPYFKEHEFACILEWLFFDQLNK